MKLTAWRVALRIARRDALRAKGRSALVLAMIALPVLGVAGADVVYRSAELEPGEKIVRLMGGADALVSAYGRGMTVLQPPIADEGSNAHMPRTGEKPTPEQQRSLTVEPAELVKQVLPAGSVLIPYTEGAGASATTRDGRLGVRTAEADLTNPVWHGKVDLVEGRAPSAPQELAATRHFLDQAGLKVGDTTSLRGLDDKPFTITGVAEYPGDLTTDQLIGRPGALVDPLARANGQSARDNGPFSNGKWLVQLPAGTVLDWPKVLEANKYGFTVTSRSVVLDPPPRSQVPYYVEQDQYEQGVGKYIDDTGLVILATVAGMALLEIVLLAGPAFAVGARRSRRQLGLLAAGGGDRSHIRAVVLGGGVVLGLAGAAVGVVLAIGLVGAVRPWLEELAGRRFGHFDLQPLDLFGVAALGLVTGLLAAVVPAVQAARQDVVEALTGRGSVKPPNRWLALLGLLMLAGGAALALFGANVGSRSTAVLGGSVIAELGMVVCTPMLVGLFGRLGRWMPLSPRLALRDSVRHRGRTAPAVAAVMAAVAGSVAVGIYTTSSDQQSREQYQASLPSGAVLLATGWGPSADAKLLPQQRAAVEQSMPALGARADVYTTGYKGDCRKGGGSCGNAEVIIPKERRCPAHDRDNTGPQMDEAEYRRLMQDPRCQAEQTRGYGGQFGMLPAGDATALHNLFGVQDPAAVQALTGGKAVVFDPVYLKDGKITIELTEPMKEQSAGTMQVGADGKVADAPKQETHEVTVEAVVATAQVPGGVALLTPETAHRLGLTTSDAGSVWLPDTVPSSSAEQKATAAVSKISGSSQLEVERGYRARNDLTSLGLTGFAAIVALGAAGIATGLAAADSQRDLATLSAVGAAGGIRRRLSGFQCGVIAAMGAVLGTISGMVPAIALRKMQGMSHIEAVMSGAQEGHVVIAIPWLNIGITLLVLPAVAVLLAMLFTRSKMTLVRRSA
ncbi:hypothetical protein GCM10010193_22310 [Kitasatospora atroaurantiaca]|uniref:Putative ABC transport system permease protein n=1 Tax=Kitasatospora atroaurantiaca TaxID=285545 RepID=A0A561EUU3_9ACTN|nr:FtsX-like permease family protein [Kitasatospora atroaurantiaca]TWE19378.1 putative ABC transport system permease protein [Kitasatospora atroaurantiaca]